MPPNSTDSLTAAIRGGFYCRSRTVIPGSGGQSVGKRPDDGAFHKRSGWLPFQRPAPQKRRRIPPSGNPEEIWRPEARKVLIEYARKDLVVRYGDFVDLVEGRSGLPGAGYPVWMHTTLQHLAEICLKRREPILSALCVNADGTVAGGYQQALENYYGNAQFDIEDHAERERLRCYHHYESQPTGQANSARRRQMHRQKNPPVTTKCPDCLKPIPVGGRGRFIDHRKKGGIPCAGSGSSA
jgi:hypothetical protein